MAVAVTHLTAFELAYARPLVLTLREAARHIPALLVLALVVGIHVPTLGYYFFGDDFLVLGDIRTRSLGEYTRDVTLLRDLTPNWRPLSMLAYWAEFQIFGFDPLPWRIVNLSLHVASVAMLYAFVYSMTRRVFVATGAALIFGVSASAVHTVTYVTAFPHLFSELLLLSSLFALHRFVVGGERARQWYGASLLLYIAGFLANEGGVVAGVVIVAYYALTSLRRRRDALDFALKMAPFGLAAALLVGGLSGCGCQGVQEGFYGPGWHMPRETWVYMSRLAFPVGPIDLAPSATEWVWGSVVAGFAIFFLIRGPGLARIAALGLVVSLMPYVPGKIWTATRYTYMALPFFAILVAFAAGFVHARLTRFSRPVAHALAAIALALLGGLYSWQTLHQTQPFLRETQRWQLLSDELRTNFEALPPHSRVYILDEEGMWSNAYWQPTWMTSVGLALYGEDVTVRALPAEYLDRLEGPLYEHVYVVEFRDGHLSPPIAAATLGAEQQE
jgi:hypothetical protein